MAVLNQKQLANQMIRQLRVLDPSASAELGTPERKLIDTFAQALADAQIDINALDSAFNLDSKFGDTLDQFLNIFSFARQKGTAAIGIVEFSRTTPSTLDILIPSGSQVSAINTDGSVAAIFRTTQEIVLPAGDLAVLAPVRSLTTGIKGNVGANTITSFGSAVVSGITGITNPNPTSGGLDSETDAAYKVRFKNTFFRNLAGTSDQYLALAVAGAITNKANVVGPISRFREYIQVPETDDATNSGNGSAGEYTTAMVSLPYSEYVYDTIPSFVSNGETGVGAIFYTEGVDFTLNAGAAKNKGDAYRFYNEGGDTDPEASPTRPNVTLLNVYADDDEAVDSIRPGDVVLFEHSFVSNASRNDLEHAVTNCVDVYVNGANSTIATTVIPTPDGPDPVFVNNSNHRYHFDNYRRLGEPDHRPQLGNYFTPLFWNPLLGLPEELVIDNFTYLRDQHYWPIIDVSENGGTVRARTGIEWSATASGLDGEDPDGPVITANDATSIEVVDYTFDKNVVDLQSALEGSKQVTTDVLVHKATERYFKFDITVMYVPGASTTGVNQNIATAVRQFLENVYFGGVIQLSDLLQTIHGVPGVDNVRWTDQDQPGVLETDINGKPRLGAVIDELVEGDAGTAEQQRLYFTGTPSGGDFQLRLTPAVITAAVAYPTDAATLDDALDALTPLVNVAGGTGTPTDPFQLNYNANGAQDLIEFVSNLEGGDRVFHEDFFLNDNEQATLPTGTVDGDTVPGFIIRARAQNTFNA